MGSCGQYSVPIKPSRSRGQYYTVQKKETVYSISRKFNVPVRSIMDINKLKPPYHLKMGQLIFIPPAQIHTVRAKETLYSISRMYGVDMNSLARQNQLKEPWTLSIGQQLTLPAASEPKTTQIIEKAATPAASAPVTQMAHSKPKSKPSTKTASVKLPSTPARTGRFDWPVKGKVISNFGPSGNGKHNDGINISAARGTAIKAAENGVVAYAGNELKGFGNLLLIKHTDGFVTAYAHADSLSVKRGQTIKKGQTIGKIGSTGNVKYPQLHFEIRKGTKAINPAQYLK